jgi:hypothetical protein
VVFQRFARTTAVALFAVLKADLHDFIVGTYICASSIVFIRDGISLTGEVVGGVVQAVGL